MATRSEEERCPFWKRECEEVVASISLESQNTRSLVIGQDFFVIVISISETRSLLGNAYTSFGVIYFGLNPVWGNLNKTGYCTHFKQDSPVLLKKNLLLPSRSDEDAREIS
jgi:hypothetical protein